MANYTLIAYVDGGEADGGLEVDRSQQPTPWIFKAHGEAEVVSIYIYRGDEQDGNVTLRRYEFAGNRSFKDAHEFAKKRFDGGTDTA